MFINFFSSSAAAPVAAADKENVDPTALDTLAEVAEVNEADGDGHEEEPDEDDLPDGEDEVHGHAVAPSSPMTEGEILADALGDVELDDVNGTEHEQDVTPSEEDVDAADAQGTADDPPHAQEDHNGEEADAAPPAPPAAEVTHPDGIEPTYKANGKVNLDGLNVDSPNFEKWQQAKPHSTRYLQQAFTGTRGARGAGARTRKCTVVEAWSRFFPTQLLIAIVTATNEAVTELSQADPANPPPWLPKGASWPPKVVKGWKKLTVPELKRWIGITYSFGILRLPKRRDYWRTRGAFQVPGLRVFMSRDRYFAILRCLKLQSAEVEARGVEEGKAKKVGVVLDMFREYCENNFDIAKEIALDEETVGCKSKYTKYTHQNNNKPAGQGYRLYAICESCSGYTFTFTFDKKDKRTIKDIVHELTSNLREVGHQIYMDNLFAKPSVLRDLNELKQYGCGTWRPNFGIPASMHALGKQLKEKGEWHVRYAAGSGLAAFVWLDSGPAYFITNMRDLDVETLVERRERGVIGRVQVSAPLASDLYNKFMIAVDLTDMMRKTFTTQRKAYKSWMPLFFWMLDTAAINAFVVFQENKKNKKFKLRQDFEEELATALASTQDDSSSSEEAGPGASGASGISSHALKDLPMSPGMLTTKHDPCCEKCCPVSFTERGDCQWCSTSKARRRVYTGCEHHNVSLHLGECWKKWHAWVKKQGQRKRRFSHR